MVSTGLPDSLNGYSLAARRAMNKTILLLVSDSGIRGTICEALESEGYFVLTASEIDRAARWVKECTPDLLMVRHYTENISGHDAAVYLRSLCPGIPVLLVGGLLNDPGLENREALLNLRFSPSHIRRSNYSAR